MSFVLARRVILDDRLLNRLLLLLMYLHVDLRPIRSTTTILRPFFRDHPGEPVPEENFWT